MSDPAYVTRKELHALVKQLIAQIDLQDARLDELFEMMALFTVQKGPMQ